ncbi:MAG: M13 family peptidase, partial [Oscillospiraceae bacterium]|nr:M13 family peptidase [Oscillospiraceae bacterium]
EADYKAFGERAQKVVEYFDAIRPFPYDSCSGAAVQGEAIADIGGLSIALKIAEGINGFDYDAFFRSHAQLWRLQTTLDNERTAIYNEHPLCHLRINTVVQQFDEFYETYGVSEGDGMYLPPESRIAVW